MISDEDFFTEEQTPNVRFSVRVRGRIHSERTAYQQLDIVETAEFGRLLALDGRVMLTERDERFYHEMLVHPAMLTHPQPQRVLVIGGGDGGAVREILQHPSVKEVLWVEIDERVMAVSREYLPAVCAGVFSDPRVAIHVMPGEQFVSRLAREVDVIIVDSTDPIGPAVSLFQMPFFVACAHALRDTGIYAAQCGTPFYFPDELRSVRMQLGQVFAHVRQYLGAVPTYPSGIWSYVMAAQKPLTVSVPELDRRCRERSLRSSYYTPELHQASGVLPMAFEGNPNGGSVSPAPGSGPQPG